MVKDLGCEITSSRGSHLSVGNEDGIQEAISAIGGRIIMINTVKRQRTGKKDLRTRLPVNNKNNTTLRSRKDTTRKTYRRKRKEDAVHPYPVKTRFRLPNNPEGFGFASSREYLLPLSLCLRS